MIRADICLLNQCNCLRTNEVEFFCSTFIEKKSSYLLGLTKHFSNELGLIKQFFAASRLFLNSHGASVELHGSPGPIQAKWPDVPIFSQILAVFAIKMAILFGYF